MQKSFLLVCVLMVSFQPGFSQNAKQALQDAWKEKTEWRTKMGAPAPNAPGNERSFTEKNISTIPAVVQSEVHAAINPTDTNNIVVSSNYADAISTAHGTNYLYYTNDFGSTWHKSNFVTGPLTPNAVIDGGGDPNFVFTDQGKAYFSWINLWSLPTFPFPTYWDLSWAYSYDGGNVWLRDSTNYQIASTPSSLFGNGSGFDKEWLAADNTPSSQFYGNLYSSIFVIDGNTNQTYIGVRKKAANSNTFDTVTSQVNSVNYQFLQFASDAVDRNGNLHVTFFGSVDGVNCSLYHAVSNDAGFTFNSETKISDLVMGRFTAADSTDSIAGILESRLYPCSYVACDATGGANNNNLYMVWSAEGVSSKLPYGTDVYFSRSTNGGQTWSPATILNDNTSNLSSDQFYPAITVSPQGRVIVMWWDRRDDPNNRNAHIYLTYSDDGGQSFAGDMKVTSVPTNFSDVGQINGGFGIGEYNCVLATNDFAIPVWADGRHDNGNLNLFAAFVDLGASPLAVHDITSINGAIKINSLYPDPVKNELNLAYETSEAGKIELSILDVDGKLVKKLDDFQTGITKGTQKINTSKLAAGTYLLNVTFNGAMNIRKFVKAE